MITWEMIKNRWNRHNVYTTAAFWDDAAARYYGKAGTNLWNNPHLNELFHDVESRTLHGWAGDVEGKCVLDIGCGAGRFSREFAERGASKIDAVDFSEKSIEVAKSLTQDDRIDYIVGSIFEVDAEARYDIIVCSKVLSIACQDVNGLRECLRRIYRALKPGGIFLVGELCHTSFVRRVLKISYKDFLGELEAAGFLVVETRQIEFVPARMLLAFFELPKWLTVATFHAGEALLRVVPQLSDQQLTFAKKIQKSD